MTAEPARAPDGGAAFRFHNGPLSSPSVAYRGSIETSGDLRDHGMGLFAHCTRPNAGHGGRVDLELLISRLGAGYIYINDRRIAAACVCRQCGWRGAELRVTASAGNATILPVREMAGVRPGVPNPQPRAGPAE